MRSTKLSQILLTLCFLPLVLCLTKRKALIKIQNNTPDTLTGVGVSHKYSDVYKEQFSWSAIAPGKLSTEDMIVEYHTGFGTTGRDWWMVTYHREIASAVRKNEVMMWYSDPQNFRSIIDFLEKIAPAAIKAAINAAKGTNPQLLPAAQVAHIASKVMCKLMFNNESTDGFKQHILESEDANQITVIVINADNTITFKSKSGNSKTVTSTRWIEGEHA
ncbi:hypothetical protein B0J11DRAFT_517310 [Dendryphion nanum]|uniref:Up-regulated in Daf-2 domain-containing protein n=1 Tax=Dendryphion nanum TaxID=256645 RepID=A0A9P9ED81_9PLEO|nr:hypothetical protein B0J11DRAFT_517310 [Dendryphion nanum]